MHCPGDEQTNDRREASEEMIDVIVTARSAVRNKSPHQWKCTRRHRYLDDDTYNWQRTLQQSQRLPRCRSVCCEDDDLVKKVGVDGSYEDEVVMGCVSWV